MGTIHPLYKEGDHGLAAYRHRQRGGDGMTALSNTVIGVLDADGLHVPDGSLAPVTGVIRLVGDLCPAARWRGSQEGRGSGGVGPRLGREGGV